MNLTCEQLYSLLSQKFETAQTDWSGHSEVPKPPYVVYVEEKPDIVPADNIAYYVEARYRVELYIRKTDYVSESKLETLLNGAEIYWEKEKIWNRELDLFQVIYMI